MTLTLRTAARVLALASSLVASGALAQGIADVQGESNGVRFGPGRLHPYLDLEGRYDSAAIYVPEGTGSATTLALKPEFLVHVRPGLRLDVPAGGDFGFGLNAFYDFVWFTGLLQKGDSRASRSEAGADMHAEINREGAVELDLADTFARSARPQDVGVGVSVISLYNQVRLGLPIHPGGHALEVKPHGEYAVEFFSGYSALGGNLCTGSGTSPAPPALCTFSGRDYQQYSGGLDARWKFLPQTALLFESSYVGRKYFSPPANTPTPGTLLNLQTGLAGLLTPKITLILKAGYAIGFKGAGGSIIGQAEAAYAPNEISSIAVGFVRQTAPTVNASRYVDNRPYLNARAFLGGRVGLHANFAYDLVDFDPGANPSADARSGKDQILSLDVGPEVAVTRWFVVAAGYVLSTRSSDYSALSLNYTRNEAYLRLTFTY